MMLIRPPPLPHTHTLAPCDVLVTPVSVINLSPSKDKVFAEAFRVLRPGGRLAVSDVVRTADMPAEVLHDLAALCGCISGAVTVAEV